MSEDDLQNKDVFAGRMVQNIYFVLTILFLINLITSLKAGMGNDEGIWNYIGQLWSNYSIPPYTGAVENKTPGIFFLFALSNSLFGMNYWFPRLVAVVAIVITALFLYLIGRRLYNHTTGTLCAYIFGLSMTWRLMDGLYTSQTETFMVLFTVIAIYNLILALQTDRFYKRYFLLIGFFLGAAISFKQIAIFSGLFVVIACVLIKPFRLNIIRVYLWIALGTIACILLSWLPLWFFNVSFMDYIDGAWLILLKSGSSLAPENRLIYFLGAWKRLSIALFYPFLFLFFINWRLLLEKNIPVVLLTIWLGLDFIAINLSGYYYGHQFKHILPVFSLITAITLSVLLDKLIKENKFRWRLQLLMVVLLLWAPHGAFMDRLRPWLAESQKEYRELGLWLKENTTPDDYIYIWGAKGNTIQAYSERRSASEYFNSIFVYIPGALEELVRDLRLNCPKWILIDRDSRYDTPDFFTDVLDDYSLVSRECGYDVYKIALRF